VEQATVARIEEEASRAAASEQALARFEKENRHPLQTLRSHER
jgi:hypothetical protein